MAKSENQKLKLLYLKQMLEQDTDEEHTLTMAQIIARLQSYEIACERKSIYNDIETLRSAGLEIIYTKNKGYFLASREFELSEVKFLVDAVQCAKFLTVKKSSQLIKKLEHLTSRFEAAQLQRQVYVSQRIKNMNESIYYNVDAIHTAILQNKQISFKYFSYVLNFSEKGGVAKEFRKNGERYTLEPWFLTFEDGNYYLIGYSNADAAIRHYRVDKMQGITVNDVKMQSKNQLENFDIVNYTKSVFGMFTGKECEVKLRVKNNLAGIIHERFGNDVILLKGPEGYFDVNVKAVPSPQFDAWIMGYGDEMKIISPESLAQQIKLKAQKICNLYK